MTRVLRPGDVYRVPDKAGLKMQTGNAGGLQVSVDGGQGTAMGTPGQVLRGVPLDPERLGRDGKLQRWMRAEAGVAPRTCP